MPPAGATTPTWNRVARSWHQFCSLTDRVSRQRYMLADDEMRSWR
jgi:hypothetical protein